jgi:cysteine desulfurase
MSSAYFDYQSSTPVLREALEAMAPYWRDVFASGSALHQQGLQVREALALAREQVAGLINAVSPEEIIFTSGGTESANLAVKGAAWASRRRGNHIVCSAIEHPAVLRSLEFLERRGFQSTRVAVDGQGFVDPAAVEEALREETVLVCVHHVNHDIGTIEPIREIAAVAGERGIPVYTDAGASGGWLPIDVQAMGVSYLSLSPHRFFGPKGVGFLYRNRRAQLQAVQHGGLQEGDRRAGTENVPAIVGAGVAAAVAARELLERRTHTTRLQVQLWDGIRERVPHTRLNGPKPGPMRVSTNLNLCVEFVEGEGIALMCDMRGIALASGASCVSKSMKGSPVLEAIGLDRSLAQSNVILSIGPDNTEVEAGYFLEIFPQVVEKLRGMSPWWEEFQSGQIQSQIRMEE